MKSFYFSIYNQRIQIIPSVIELRANTSSESDVAIGLWANIESTSPRVLSENIKMFLF
jgi:hypothetical protein